MYFYDPARSWCVSGVVIYTTCADSPSDQMQVDDTQGGICIQGFSTMQHSASWKSCDIVMDITIFHFVEFVTLLWI